MRFSLLSTSTVLLTLVLRPSHSWIPHHRHQVVLPTLRRLSTVTRRNYTLTTSRNIIKFMSTISEEDADRALQVYDNVVNRISTLSHIAGSQKKEMFNALYWPVYSYLMKQRQIFLENRQQHDPQSSAPFFVGISAPQGCGKTTLTAVLEEMFSYEGISATSMSLDDFYLTGSDQDALSHQFPDNALLQYRGNAGTHDLTLLKDTMQTLRTFTGRSKQIEVVPAIPRYDKSLRQGRGDRAQYSQWTKIVRPLDIVLYEGWMLGFTPKQSNIEELAELNKLHAGLLEVNTQLRRYSQLHRSFDTWLVFAIESPEVVYRWRLQAEQNMRAMGKPSLTDEQVKDFVDRFMPAYQAYLSTLYRNGPERRDDVSSLQINVDTRRQPKSFEERLPRGMLTHPKAKL